MRMRARWRLDRKAAVSRWPALSRFKTRRLAAAFRPPVSTFGCDGALQGGVLQGVVGVVVLPESRDDLAPGASEDAGGVSVAGASGSGAGVDVGGPGAVAAAGVGEGA